MLMDLPLSSDSTAASSSWFFSMRSASLSRWMPRCCGVVLRHVVWKAFLLGGLADGGDDLLCGGVDDLEGLLVDTLNPLVVDEESDGLLVGAREGGLELNEKVRHCEDGYSEDITGSMV